METNITNYEELLQASRKISALMHTLHAESDGLDYMPCPELDELDQAIAKATLQEVKP